MRCFIVAAALLMSLGLKAQFGEDYKFRELFIAETIQIEEFIERFNFDKNTRYRQYLKTNNPGIEIGRDGFIRLLFDGYKLDFDQDLAKQFITDVTDIADPKYLNFIDADWYAEVNCIFEYNADTLPGNLILRVQQGPEMSSKWSLASVYSEVFELTKNRDSSLYISPTSHGTDFIGLFNIFKDRDHFQNYMIDEFEADQLTYLYLLVLNDKLSLIQVREVKYHFLQIPDWIFTVEYFNRDDKYRGWLISDFFRSGIVEKEFYKKEILHLNKNY